MLYVKNYFKKKKLKIYAYKNNKKTFSRKNIVFLLCVCIYIYLYFSVLLVFFKN